jgi:hypothetical protein
VALACSIASWARRAAVVRKPLATTAYMAYGNEAASPRTIALRRIIATISSTIVTPS